MTSVCACVRVCVCFSMAFLYCVPGLNRNREAIFSFGDVLYLTLPDVLTRDLRPLEILSG